MKVRLYNHDESKTAVAMMLLFRYEDASGNPLKVKVGTPFESDIDFTSVSGNKYKCEPKKNGTFELDGRMLGVPAEAATVEILASSVSALAADGVAIEDWWSQERPSELLGGEHGRVDDHPVHADQEPLDGGEEVEDVDLVPSGDDQLRERPAAGGVDAREGRVVAGPEPIQVRGDGIGLEHREVRHGVTGSHAAEPQPGRGVVGLVELLEVELVPVAGGVPGEVVVAPPAPEVVPLPEARAEEFVDLVLARQRGVEVEDDERELVREGFCIHRRRW
jgi:hypothetical protein